MKCRLLIALWVIVMVGCAYVPEMRAQASVNSTESIDANDPLMAEAWQLAEEAKGLGILTGNETPQEIYELGFEYYHNNDFDSIGNAVRLYALAAVQGYALAQSNLGECYLNGDLVPEDYEKALKWYHKSGDKGINALLNSGLSLAAIGDKTLEFFRKAAEQGDVIAQCFLGAIYEHGVGVVSQNDKEALKWYRKAADSGYACAQNYLGWFYKCRDDYKKSAEWYRKAAEHGYAEGQYNFGRCYEFGEGVPHDDTKAIEWYLKAAEQDNAWAECRLGLCYKEGMGVPMDYDTAIEWYRKAAEHGDAGAQYELGNYYFWLYDDDNDPHNLAQAVKWHRKAAEWGLVDSQYILGECYEYGRGVEKDIDEAIKWYREAAGAGVDYSARKALKRLGIEMEYEIEIDWETEEEGGWSQPEY